jgi:flagellar FlgN protein
MTPTPGDALEAVLTLNGSGNAFGPLDELLWRERHMLERLAYRLASQHALITLGNTRWLHRSDVEVASAVRELRRQEVMRAAETEHLLRRLHLPADTSLAGIAASAPMPWSLMFEDHWAAMRTLETEIRETAARTVALLEDLAGDDET